MRLIVVARWSLACLALAASPTAAFDLDGIKSGMSEQQLVDGRRDKSLTVSREDDGAIALKESGESRYHVEFCQSKTYFVLKIFQPSAMALTALIDSTTREFGSPKVSTRMDVTANGEVRFLMFDFPRGQAMRPESPWCRKPSGPASRSH